MPVRKSGKLPAHTLRQEYALEYGSDCVEVHADALPAGARVLASGRMGRKLAVRHAQNHTTLVS